MKTYVKPGFTVTHTHTADIASGEALLLGDQLVVSCGKYLANTEGEFMRAGVHLLPKAAVAIAKNVKLYWDNTNKVLTNVASGNTLAGISDQAALSGDASVCILLNGLPYKF